MKSEKPKIRKIQEKLDFDKLLKLLLIFGIILTTGFILYHILKPKSGYITFGILNSDMSADDYPTNTLVGENISFYIFIGNHLNRELNFRLDVLIGDNNTYLALNHPTNGSSYLNITSNILNGVDWISNLINVSFSEPGINRLIIAELWIINADLTEKFYNSLYTRLNVTL
ncbi:MAG: DUF1616 domain-containing protein [Promethearchaeota archaeon]|nr:MAG: DUF1616 domain-containing protein [Candidatus Lokiarchaeota archaeon]